MIVLVAVVVLLVAAPAATAKEIARVEVCGRGDCNVLVPGKGPVGDGLQQRDLLELTEVVGPANPPPTPSGWFRVRVTIEHHGAGENSWTNAWVPSARLLRARDGTGEGYTWFTVPRDTALSFLKVTRKLEPLPAATLRGLEAKLPSPRVDQLVTAPGPPGRDGGVPWAWIALAVALVGLTAARLRRRLSRLLHLVRRVGEPPTRSRPLSRGGPLPPGPANHSTTKFPT